MNHRIAIGMLFCLTLTACEKGGPVRVEERQSADYKVKTYFDNASGNVEVLVATSGSESIVALPKSAIARAASMGDDELSCLGKCAKIEDLEARLNCILLCPVTTKWNVALVLAQK